MSNAGNFICAALPSVYNHTNTALKSHPDYINHENLNRAFLDNCNKYLSSVGVNLQADKRLKDNYMDETYLKMLNKFEDAGFLKNIELTLDSAGYQFQTGYFNKEDTYKWIKIYHKFLTEQVDKYSYSFSFDPVPGPVDTILDNYKEMEKFNIHSLKKANELPQHVRDKMLYIHHFRTPKIRKLYNKMMHDEKLANGFTNFATGGLVSFAANSKSPFPVTMYIVPLIDLILHAQERGLTKFRFHVLGGSEWKDILVHKFFEKHIKTVHGIDIEITYDSSSVFKAMALGRYMFVPDENSRRIYKMNFHSKYLNTLWLRKNRTVNDQLHYMLNNLARDYDLKELDIQLDPIYHLENPNDKVERLSKIHYVYLILLVLKTFRLADKWSKEIVDELYPIYQNGEPENFNFKINQAMINFNNGKVSRNTNYRTATVYNSLKMLETLDQDKADYLVKFFFSKDECFTDIKTCTF